VAAQLMNLPSDVMCREMRRRIAGLGLLCVVTKTRRSSIHVKDGGENEPDTL
jgi:hypothetical protein